MTTIFEYIKQYIQYALSRLYTTRIGEVTNVDPTGHLVRVKVMPEAIITGWIPLLVPLLGVRGLPKLGDQAFVSYVFETPAAVLGFSYNNVDVPEAAILPSQFRMTQGTGAHKADLLIDGTSGTVAVTGALTANGRGLLYGFNPHDYGAIGDGASHPLSTLYTTLADAQAVYSFATSLAQELDYCGIQKAANMAQTTATGAALVCLAAGKYILGTLGTITLGAGTAFCGNGWGSTYLVPTDTSHDVIAVNVGGGSQQNHNLLSGFAIYPQTNFTAGAGIHLGRLGKLTLRDIKIDASLGGKPYYGVQIDQVSDTAFQNVRVEGTVSDAWHLANPDATTIVELFWDAACTARNAGGWGFNVVPGNATSGNGDIEGLHWEATSIYSNTLGGINLNAGTLQAGKTIRNIHLNGTYLDTNLGPGLQTSGTAIIENLSIQGIWASANTGRGLDLGANVRAFIINGGKVLQNGLDGVQINGAQNGTVNALLIKSNSQTTDLASYGVVVTGSAQEVVFSNLHIYNDAGGYPHRQNGVYVGNSVLDIDFKNIKADTGSGTTKLSHNAASSARVRYASFQDNTGSNNVEQGMSISSGSAIYTRDGFGSVAMTGNLSVSGSSTHKQITSSLTGGGKISQGSGAPSLPNSINPAVGDVWLRTDTPGVANQFLYVCTVGGGTPTWVGKL